MGFIKSVANTTKNIINTTANTTKQIIHLADKTASIGKATLPIITATAPATAEVTIPAMGAIAGYDALKNQLSGN